VKLLFDENLSARVPVALRTEYPQSVHVTGVGLSSATDEAVWQYAREHGFAIVSKDSDFRQRSFLLGPPPKVVWIRRGNCSSEEIITILRERRAEILEFGGNEEAAFLALL
jgi:predicted nuclease of predicted toxin-antitoxin system